MKAALSILAVLCLPTFLFAAPGPAPAGKVVVEYNSATGELLASSGGVVNFFVQSATSKIIPINPPPVVPVGLLTNNAGRVGITNLGPINLTDFSFGSIGKGLATSDLTLNYTSALGQKAVVVPACSGIEWVCVPEPTSLGLLGLGVFGLIGTRRTSPKKM